MSKIEINNKNKTIALITLIGTTMFHFCAVYIPYRVNGEIGFKLDNYTNIFMILSALSCYYLIRHYYEKKKTEGLILDQIAKLTFGIYLFHILINYRIYDFRSIQYIFSLNSYIGIIVLEIVVFLICGIFTAILRKIPIIRKFL